MVNTYIDPNWRHEIDLRDQQKRREGERERKGREREREREREEEEERHIRNNKLISGYIA